MNDNKRRVIALGFFDGVHLGHGALLQRVVQLAAQMDAVPCAFTFDIHPESLILGHRVPLLSSPEDRAGLMRRLYGIEDVIVARYDRQMMRTPWQSFVTDTLVAQWNPVHLVVGYDFRFGYRGEGDPELLRGLCDELGIGCDIIRPVVREGITVSSTYVRTLVAQGEMERACAFLGHPHVLSAAVTHGKKLGRTLGYPTVNQTFPEDVLIPAHGVYAARAVVDGHTYDAVTNVGVRPTVDSDDKISAESFLLDFEGDLYGKEIRLEFHKFLRPERRFADCDTLRDEIGKNVQQVRQYFNRSKQ